MADTKSSSASRGKYSTAGYMGEERELYISKVPAGSAQDDLWDLNKPGYRVARPWNESPEPVFTKAEKKPEEVVVQKRKLSFVETMVHESKKDRLGAGMCIVLTCVLLMMAAIWSRQMVEGVQIEQDIRMYQNGIEALEAENEGFVKRLAVASAGERIRNLAQNELGMLRPERAAQETIYITIPNNLEATTVQESGEPRMDVLDILLGLLHVFNIGE